MIGVGGVLTVIAAGIALVGYYPIQFSVVFVSCWFGLIAVIECCEACSVVWFVIGCELLVVCVVVVCV